MLSGRTVGELVNEVIRSYLARPKPRSAASLADLGPEDDAAGAERLSEEIDAVGYGA